MTLRNKLQALTAPCREVDAEIAKAFGVPETHFLGFTLPLRYTASLDAVVDLVEREMPGKNWSVVRFEDSDTITTIGDGDRVIADGKHTLPAVALLLALLEAKEIGDE